MLSQRIADVTSEKRRSLSASATLISSVSRKIGPHSSKSQAAMKIPCVILRGSMSSVYVRFLCIYIYIYIYICIYTYIYMASRCEEVVQGWEAVFEGQGDQVA